MLFQDEGRAVGFMSVCSNVNIEFLHECFDLGPFHGLCKPHPDDILKLEQLKANAADATDATDTGESDVVQCFLCQDLHIIQKLLLISYIQDGLVL